jgi:MFS family permease
MQAAGGSALNPVALSIISNTMADDGERARAFGLWGAIVGVGLAAGPVLGGVLVHAIGWRSIFWLTVPIGVIAILLTHRFVPESRAGRARRPDPLAQLLLFLTIGILTTAIIEGQDTGWGSPAIIALFAVALVGGVALAAVERHRSEPLLDPRFFRSAPFSGATLIAVASFGAVSGFLFINTLYLQTARGEDVLDAGLLTLPMALMIFIFAQTSGRLVARYGARLPFLLAGPAMAAGALMLVALHSHTSIAYLLISYVIFGVGMGLVNAPISNTAVSGMPRAQSGVAAAVASTGRLIGATLGVAIAGSLVAGSTAATFATASHAAWIFLGGLGVFVLIAGLASTSRWAQQTASQAASVISEENVS